MACYGWLTGGQFGKMLFQTHRKKGENSKESGALDRVRARTVGSFQNLEAGGLSRGVEGYGQHA